jgi:hypothetical protein
MDHCLPKSPANRRYLKRFVVTMGAYVIFLLLASWAFKHHHPVGPVAYGLALLPALAIIGVIISVGLYIAEETDEFQRNVMIEAMIWAVGATLAFTTVWGFLEMFVHIQPLQPFIVFPLFWFVEGIATTLLKLRYR